MAIAYRLDAISQGPKNSGIPRPNPFPPTLLMDMHASKTLCTGLYKSQVHRVDLTSIVAHVQIDKPMHASIINSSRCGQLINTDADAENSGLFLRKLAVTEFSSPRWYITLHPVKEAISIAVHQECILHSPY